MRSMSSPREAVRDGELHAPVDAGMNHDAAGERLVRVERDLEARAELVRDLRPVALGRIRPHEPARRFERAIRGREAMSRQQRRHEARARRAADVKRLGHRPELLADADRLRRRDAERHGRAVRIESEEPRAGCGRAEHSGRPRDVPPAVVVVGIDRVADAACDVDPDHQRIDELPPRGAEVLGQRQRRRRDGARGMDDRGEVRVVVVERVRRNAVQQRGARHVDTLAAAQERCLRAGRELPHGRERGFDRRVARRADGAADPVQEGAVRLALDAVVPAPRRMRRDELGKEARDRWRISR